MASAVLQAAAQAAVVECSKKLTMKRLLTILLLFAAITYSQKASAQHVVAVTGGAGMATSRLYPAQETRPIWGVGQAGFSWRYYSLPRFVGGFGIDLEAYGVTLSISCAYRIGGYGYDNQYALLMHSDNIGSMNWHKDIMNSWTENNTKTDVPRLSNGNDLYANMGSDRFLTSNSYLSLNNINLGYKFPKKLIEKIKLQKLNVYVAANNLAIATARRGYNPMTSFTGSSDTHAYSPLSTIIGGVKFTF